MLSRIPRMETIARIIAQQNSETPVFEANSIEQRREVEFGVQLLRTGLAFDGFLARGLDPSDAAIRVRASLKGIDNAILLSLDDLAPSVLMQVGECAVSDLAPGMIIQEDLRNGNGLLIVGKGQELTFRWVERLKGFWQRGEIGRKVSVSMPQSDED